jgi:hypothetical protein
MECVCCGTKDFRVVQEPTNRVAPTIGHNSLDRHPVVSDQGLPLVASFPPSWASWD